MRVWGWVRRHLVVTGLVLVVLAGAGVAVPLLHGGGAEPPCGGILREDLLDELREGEGGYEELWRHSRQLGSIECLAQSGVGGQEGRVFVRAVTAPNDVDARLVDIYNHISAGATMARPLPEGLPGFADFRDHFYLLPHCPALEPGFDGRQRSMLVDALVDTSGDWDTRLRVAVAAANAASGELGCGAEPLTLPDGDRPVTEPPETVPLAEAGRSRCAVPSREALPELRERVEEWRVTVGATDSSPVTTCTLWGFGLTLLGGFYGEWSDAVRARSVPYGEEDGTPPLSANWQSSLTERQGFATAECDGEPAVFLVEPELSEDFTREQIYAVLATFATDQADRRGCTGLRLPAAPSGQSE